MFESQDNNDYVITEIEKPAIFEKTNLLIGQGPQSDPDDAMEAEFDNYMVSLNALNENQILIEEALKNNRTLRFQNILQRSSNLRREISQRIRVDGQPVLAYESFHLGYDVRTALAAESDSNQSFIMALIRHIINFIKDIWNKITGAESTTRQESTDMEKKIDKVQSKFNAISSAGTTTTSTTPVFLDNSNRYNFGEILSGADGIVDEESCRALVAQILRNTTQFKNVLTLTALADFVFNTSGAVERFATDEKFRNDYIEKYKDLSSKFIAEFPVVPNFEVDMYESMHSMGSISGIHGLTTLPNHKAFFVWLEAHKDYPILRSKVASFQGAVEVRKLRSVSPGGFETIAGSLKKIVKSTQDTGRELSKISATYRNKSVSKLEQNLKAVTASTEAGEHATDTVKLLQDTTQSVVTLIFNAERSLRYIYKFINSCISYGEQSADALRKEAKTQQTN